MTMRDVASDFAKPVNVVFGGTDALSSEYRGTVADPSAATKGVKYRLRPLTDLARIRTISMRKKKYDAGGSG